MRSGRKAKDSDVEVKDEKRHGSWQGGRWKRIRCQTRPDITAAVLLILSLVAWPAAASHAAASAVTETQTDDLLHLQQLESDGHSQLM